VRCSVWKKLPNCHCEAAPPLKQSPPCLTGDRVVEKASPRDDKKLCFLAVNPQRWRCAVQNETTIVPVIVSALCYTISRCVGALFLVDFVFIHLYRPCHDKQDGKKSADNQLAYAYSCRFEIDCRVDCAPHRFAKLQQVGQRKPGG